LFPHPSRQNESAAKSIIQIFMNLRPRLPKAARGPHRQVS